MFHIQSNHFISFVQKRTCGYSAFPVDSFFVIFCCSGEIQTSAKLAKTCHLSSKSLQASCHTIPTSHCVRSLVWQVSIRFRAAIIGQLRAKKRQSACSSESSDGSVDFVGKHFYSNSNHFLLPFCMISLLYSGS